MSALDIAELIADCHAAVALIAVGIPDARTRVPTDVGDRMQRSVVRPLTALMDEEPGGPLRAGGSVEGSAISTTLWRLAQRATALCAAAAAPAELVEAAAGLQEIACSLAAADGAEALRARLGELESLLGNKSPSIQTAKAGPLLVTKITDMQDWLGQPLPARPLMALCRCGTSAMKPFCDGSHAFGFDDAKDPSRVPDRRDSYVGQQVTILDNRGTCQHSAFCTDRLSTVFRLREDPFVTPSGGRMDEIIRAVRACPSGALSYAIDGVEARADVDYHGTRAPSIEVTKDGPYRVRGFVPLVDAQGNDVSRDDGASTEHYALCRCGHARNKPYCTGMHWYVEFHDPLRAADSTPTMFEWAGGLPALTRMTRLFYEKFVPADDLLAPLFARMSPDHPERVAEWLAEVFGGPTSYSAEHGGYSHMLSQHIAKRLNDAMRGRWVALLLQSAHEAGLPNDAEFRSAFQAYIEWGTRLAVENSQTDARPPLHMPMPHWDWNTSAGPPGSRLSALASTPESPDSRRTLPRPDEAVTFTTHIKGFFRARDRSSMRFAFDLALYADVSTHAEAILERVRNGSMPCDGPWPQDRVEAFARWVAEGKPE